MPSRVRQTSITVELRMSPKICVLPRHAARESIKLSLRTLDNVSKGSRRPRFCGGKNRHGRCSRNIPYASMKYDRRTCSFPSNYASACSCRAPRGNRKQLHKRGGNGLRYITPSCNGRITISAIRLRRRELRRRVKQSTINKHALPKTS